MHGDDAADLQQVEEVPIRRTFPRLTFRDRCPAHRGILTHACRAAVTAVSGTQRRHINRYPHRPHHRVTTPREHQPTTMPRKSAQTTMTISMMMSTPGLMAHLLMLTASAALLTDRTPGRCGLAVRRSCRGQRPARLRPLGSVECCLLERRLPPRGRASSQRTTLRDHGDQPASSRQPRSPRLRRSA
jgi:hypothetical protein